MSKYTFLIIFFILCGALFFLRRVLPWILRSEEISKKRFVCPNCGHVFYAKKTQIFFRQATFYMTERVKLKCPKCKKKDMCGYSFQDN